jgi:hypothetical protein
VNLRYCNNSCPIGQKESKEILDNNNSAYDAALDFMWFAEKCFETCPYKAQHTKSE